MNQRVIECFSCTFRDFFMQRFDEDFKEYVDIEGYEEVKQGDKIVILIKAAVAPSKVATEETSQVSKC